MAPTADSRKSRVVIGAAEVDALIGLLGEEGYEVIGPRIADGAVVYEPVSRFADLPAGYAETQAPGRYRLEKTDSAAVFSHTVGPQAWKRYLYPAEQLLFRSSRQGKNLRITEETALKRQAYLGVRPCDIAAIRIHDKVFDSGSFTDPGYAARRHAAFIVAANCTRSGSTCFCASMNTGPKAKEGYDIALTELSGGGAQGFLAVPGSPRGAEVLARLKGRPASEDDVKRAEAAVAQAAQGQTRTMPANIAGAIAANMENGHWDKVAQRCVNCANCTMVCPTCFCSTVDDVTDLSGDNAERWRRWDSCFNIDFSYIHGGSIRREASSRYRQWMSHKLNTWHEQFGTSGCVGCGRCIVWCPVGIDITEEARALAGAKDARDRQGD